MIRISDYGQSLTTSSQIPMHQLVMNSIHSQMYTAKQLPTQPSTTTTVGFIPMIG